MNLSVIKGISASGLLNGIDVNEGFVNMYMVI